MSKKDYDMLWENHCIVSLKYISRFKIFSFSYILLYSICIVFLSIEFKLQLFSKRKKFFKYEKAKIGNP